MKPNPVSNQATTPDFILQSGHLEVGDGHRIFFEEWGNPEAPAIFHLHGGPGGSFSERHKVLYDPSKHRVIFHDQRGCGKSTPFAVTKHNTTQDLIADIELLRQHFGLENFYLAGGSWGSTLALSYSIAHPEAVRELMLWSIFLGLQSETDYVNQGIPRDTFPEAWQRFISLVPEEQRHSGTAVMEFFAGKVHCGNPEIEQQFADEWTLWEASLVSMDYNQARLETEVLGDPENLAIARLELHYLMHGCFIPENHILSSLDRIRHITCSAVQGRFDFCTPPSGAIRLSKEYGPNLTLNIVQAGHLRTEPEILAKLQAIALERFI